MFSWPKKIMPPRHQDTKVHKDFYYCVVETFLLKFVISKKKYQPPFVSIRVFSWQKNNATKPQRLTKNFNSISSCQFVCIRGKKKTTIDKDSNIKYNHYSFLKFSCLSIIVFWQDELLSNLSSIPLFILE